MISSNSTWDRGRRKASVSPAFSLSRARVVYEFPNRESQKIFSHKLGNITFRENLGTELNSSRNDLISQTYGQRDMGGYRYKPVSHTHILSQLLPDLTIFAHGAPRSGGYENCSLVGASCSEGTDSKCEVGKCKIGRLTRVEGEKWKYESFTIPDVYYYVYGAEHVRLKSIVRGKFSLPAGSGEVNINVPASVECLVYLPPNTYSAETFTRRVIKSFYQDSGYVRSITDSLDNFIRLLLDGNQSESKVELEVKERLLDTLFSSTNKAWHSPISDTVEKIWEDQSISNREFLIQCYSELTDLYVMGLQVSTSSIKSSKVSVDGHIGRPIYGRLPGISGAYNSDSGNTAAKWLTAGADNELSGSKTMIDTFYRVFLDPQTCYPLNLDWIAQHMGFIGGLWDLEWSSKIKRTLIANAHVNRAEGLPWTTDSDLDTLRRIDLSKIERVSVDGSSVTLAYRYSQKEYDAGSGLTTIQKSNELVVDMSRWQGILPSRGNMLTLLFMLWAMGVKAPSPEEMVFNESDSTFSVRSGLRSTESSAPVNTPYIVDVLRVGDETDAEVYNYPNQIIADVSTCQDELSANTTILRMPFYYNRDGRSWDAAKSVLDNYVPDTSIKRVQYAYADSDLLVADDIFFEPVIDNG